MHRTGLEAALKRRFGGTPAERRAVSRAAQDVADSARPSRDRGHAVTIPEILSTLDEAPADTSVVERWNWWMGAIDIAYSGYEEFTVRFVDDDEEADIQR